MALKIIDNDKARPVALRRVSKRVAVAPVRRIRDKVNPNLCPVCGKSLYFNAKLPDAETCTGHKNNVDIPNIYKVSLDRHYYSRFAGDERVKQTMLKIINESERRMPKSNAGKYAMLSEVQEIREAMAKLPEGKSIECTMDDKNFKALKADNAKANPAKSIVNFFRRYIAQNGLAFKAYANDEKTVTVMRFKAAAKATHKK